MRSCALVLVAALGLAGCATPVQHQTASGKPEILVAGATPETVKPAVVNRMVSAGYRITKDTPYELAFDRPVENVAAAVLLGSKYDSTPNARVSYTIAGTGTGTRVVADLAVITNPGSAFERRTDFNGSQDTVKIQGVLDQVRGDLEAATRQAAAEPPKPKR